MTKLFLARATAARGGRLGALGAAVVALLAVMLLELALRVRGPQAVSDAHPLLGVNDYRGPSVTSERNPRGVRMIVVGDDWAWGDGVPAEHAWPSQVEGLFARDGRASRVEVLNAAQCGDRAEDALRRVETHLLELQPTWLLVSLGARDALAAFASSPPAPWWERSALVRLFADARVQSELEPVDRVALNERIRRAQFDFGVRIARLVEAAWERRVYVALVQPPWPPHDGLVGNARQVGANEVEGREAARLLHAALCEELARVASVADVLLIDARGSVDGAANAFDGAGRLTAQGAKRISDALYAALRPRIP